MLAAQSCSNASCTPARMSLLPGAAPGEPNKKQQPAWLAGGPRRWGAQPQGRTLLLLVPDQEQQPALLAGLGTGEPSRTPAPTPPTAPAPGCAMSCCDSRSRTITSFAMDWNTCAAPARATFGISRGGGGGGGGAWEGRVSRCDLAPSAGTKPRRILLQLPQNDLLRWTGAPAQRQRTVILLHQSIHLCPRRLCHILPRYPKPHYHLCNWLKYLRNAAIWSWPASGCTQLL